MPIKQVNPYLNYNNGEASKAIALYESALGAKVENLQRYGDVPGNAPAPEMKDRVIHAVLRIGTGLVMISDAHVPTTRGTNTFVSLDFDDPAEMQKRFDALAQGGQVIMPLQDTFWGAKFGMLADAYGIQWMFNANLKK